MRPINSKKRTRQAKVGQACGWQEVEENFKVVSREETPEARDQPERRKPTHKKRRQRLKLRLLA
jgi:hypothetical protein